MPPTAPPLAAPPATDAGPFGPNTRAVQEQIAAIGELDALDVLLLATAWAQTPIEIWRQASGIVSETAGSAMSQTCTAARDELKATTRQVQAGLNLPLARSTAWSVALVTFEIVDALVVAHLATDTGIHGGLTPAHLAVLAGPWRLAMSVRERLGGLDCGPGPTLELATCLLADGWAGPLDDLPAVCADLLTPRTPADWQGGGHRE